MDKAPGTDVWIGEEIMNNYGNKIMALATMIAFIDIIGGVLVGIYFFSKDIPLLGVIAIVVGIVLYPFTWILSGFGQLVNEVHEIRSNFPRRNDEGNESYINYEKSETLTKYDNRENVE